MTHSVEVDFGLSSIPLEIPEICQVEVLDIAYEPGLEQPETAVALALEDPIASPPLAQLAAGRRDAVIVISDITRPVPNRIILPPVLRTLEAAGIPRDQITILIATGIHRPNEGAELAALVGPEIAASYRCVNHLARNPDELRLVGEFGDSVPVFLNRRYLDADLKICTGLIEPHLLAGFSGGRKSVLPGLTSLETMKRLHGYRMVAHPLTVAGNLDTNPFHLMALQIARQVGVDFIVNVTLNRQRQISAVFAGDLDWAHRAGAAHVQRQATTVLPAPCDIAVTCGAGDPLDRTLYQATKGMTAAARVLRPGGTIVFAAAMREGEGSREFIQLIEQTSRPEDYLDRAREHDFIQVDQWMFQELCEVVREHPVYCFTEAFPPERVRQWMVTPVPSLQAGFDRALADQGPACRVAVFPRGAYAIGVLDEATPRSHGPSTE